MNFNTYKLNLVVVDREVMEALKALFHTILFHRTTGKHIYKQDNTFSVGTVGIEEVECHSIDLTYIQCEAPDLDQWVTSQIATFTSSLSQKQSLPITGQLTLEFFERKKGRWLLPGETVSWEAWQINVSVVKLKNEEEWLQHRASLSSNLSGLILNVIELINKSEYTPKSPRGDEIDNVYDLRFQHVQPYLHKFSYQLQEESVGSTVKKILQNTFNY